MAQPLSDFEPMIPDLAAMLSDTPEVQAQFNALTPGYQREWARFVFGAKAQATKDRHFEQMVTVLQAGYKSKRAYDSRPK